MKCLFGLLQYNCRNEDTYGSGFCFSCKVSCLPALRTRMAHLMHVMLWSWNKAWALSRLPQRVGQSGRQGSEVSQQPQRRREASTRLSRVLGFGVGPSLTEMPEILVHAGFGMQLLSLRLGENGVGLSLGTLPSAALSAHCQLIPVGFAVTMLSISSLPQGSCHFH